jgi:YHS domain-containing protein
MYRIIIVLVLLTVLYFLLRSAIRKLKEHEGPDLLPTDKDQMVQDPVCRVFVPRGNAVTEVIGGQTYCFCGRTCAERFQKQMAG